MKNRESRDSDPDPDICCVYTRAFWIQIRKSDHLSRVDCDLDLNLDSGPGAHVNSAYSLFVWCTCINVCLCMPL